MRVREPPPAVPGGKAVGPGGKAAGPGGKASTGAGGTENIELSERQAAAGELDRRDLDTVSLVDDMGRRGHILWIRGLTRLQTQVTPVTRMHRD